MSLKELIENQMQEKQNDTLDESKVQEQVEKYKEMVSVFYDSVLNDWLKDLNDDNLLNPEYQDLTISEEETGEYHVKALTIMMARTKVRFRPIGTFLIGTPGRIDMYVNGNSEPVMFIIVGENATSPRIVPQMAANGEKSEKTQPTDYGKYVWKFVDKSNKIRYVSLDSSVFQQIIMNEL